MANPDLEPLFGPVGDQPSSSVMTNGWTDGLIPSGPEHTYLWHQLYEAANKSANDGIWDWEDPGTSDREYNIGSITLVNGVMCYSKVDSNTADPSSDDGTNWVNYLPMHIVADSSIAFGIPLKAGTMVLDLATGLYYRTTAIRTAANTLGDGSVEVTIDGLVKDVDSFTDLQSIDVSLFTSVHLKELHTDIPESGGLFIYDSTVDKSTANAGTIIDPSVSLANQGTGSGLGCWVRQYSGDVNVKWFNSDYEKACNYCETSGKVLAIDEDVDIKIPSYFSDLQAAFDSTIVSQTAKINVLLETGTVISNGLLLDGGDYSNITITAEDTITYLSAGFTGVAAETTQPNSLFGFINCTAPTLGCVIQADDKCAAGYVLFHSKGYVLPDCGVTHVGSIGLYVVKNSYCLAAASVFTYAGLMGCRVTTNSSLEGEGILLNNVEDRGWPDPGGNRGAIDISRGSIVNLKTQGTNITNLSNCAGHAMGARRSFVSADEVLADNCTATAFNLGSGAVVNIPGASITNCGSYAINAGNLSRCNASSADMDNSSGTTATVRAASGAKIDVSSATITNSASTACRVEGGGKIIASGANCSFATEKGLYALSGGKIVANDLTCDMTGSGAGSYAVYATAGAEVNLIDAILSNSTSGTDIYCGRGSIVQAYNATGVLSKTANTISFNGIIFQ
jgi:hypothetical protein